MIDHWTKKEYEDYCIVNFGIKVEVLHISHNDVLLSFACLQSLYKISTVMYGHGYKQTAEISKDKLTLFIKKS